MRNRTENQITLVFIRHGKTRSNEEHRYLGQEDESLWEGGIEELREKAKAGLYPPVDCLFTSPMKRCLETAKLLYPDKTARIIPRWREIDFGLFSGKTYEELQSNPDYQKWLDSKGTLPFPKGESREEFEKRCEEGFWEMLALIDQADETGMRKRKEAGRLQAGVIVHGGTIMALLSRYGRGEYFDYQINNGEVVWVKVGLKSLEPEYNIIKRQKVYEKQYAITDFTIISPSVLNGREREKG